MSHDRAFGGEEVRLQVYLARSGHGSRRSSEDLIRKGRVQVNGEPAELGMKVDPEEDEIRLDGRVVNPRRLDWILLHKPRGYVTTRDDPEGRKTVYDLLPPELHHLFHVGRLDRDSSGALLLTNDGKLANRLLHPRYGTVKEYRVDVVGKPSPETIRRLREGVKLEDGLAQALSATPLGRVDRERDIHRLILRLEEGRNREIRRMMEAVGHPVHRLFRSTFGPIGVKGLSVGKWRRLEQEELEKLRK